MEEKVFTNLTNGGPVSVYVSDGTITRIRPLQVPKDAYPPSWEIEAGGKTYRPPKAIYCSTPTYSERSRVYSKDRILYPMKRVDFDVHGERNPQNRGKSGYERITWDEALDIVAGEIKRITETYGGHAITGITSSHHNWGVAGYKMGPFARFMNMLNYTRIVDNPDSWEGWHWGVSHMLGCCWRLGNSEQYDLLSDGLQNTELIVFWSADPDSTNSGYCGQNSHIWRRWLKEKGVQFVHIDPHFNYTAATLGGTWLPPRPGSDTALAMAIAYTWLTEGTYDKEYIQEKTYGFDKFEAYILGKEDGVPKTCAWAAEESGIPAKKILALARLWAKKRTALAAGNRGGFGGACRTAYGSEWARMMVALQAMQGLGKPGISLWGTTQGAPHDYTWSPGYSDPQGHMGEADFAIYKPMKENKTKQILYRLTFPDAVLNGRDDFWGDGFCGNSLDQQFHHHTYPIEGPVKMFYRYGNSFMGTMSDTNKWVRMYQSDKLDFVVMQDCWEGSELRFADVILPACTNFERDDFGEWSGAGGYGANGHIGTNWRILVREQKCIEPRGESKADYDIFTMLADRLGMKDIYTDEGKTMKDWVRLLFESSEFVQKGIITWEEFDKKGYYIVPPPTPETYEPHPAFRWFAEGRPCDTPDFYNPKLGTDKAHEMGTKSGLIEFEAQSLVEFKPDDAERPPVPHWIPSWEGYRSETWKRYPLQIISPHPRFSFHTHYDKHASWVNEIPLHRVLKDGYRWWPVRINPKDANDRAIKGGDIVELYNDRGSVLCYAVVTNRVPEGVLHSYASCAKYDPVAPVPGATDRAGCINLLTSSRMLSQYAPGMTPNSCLCEVRKWEG